MIRAVRYETVLPTARGLCLRACWVAWKARVTASSFCCGMENGGGTSVNRTVWARGFPFRVPYRSRPGLRLAQPWVFVRQGGESERPRMGRCFRGLYCSVECPAPVVVMPRFGLYLIIYFLPDETAIDIRRHPCLRWCPTLLVHRTIIALVEANEYENKLHISSLGELQNTSS